MTVSTRALRHARRWAAAFSLVVPLWANAAALPAVDMTSEINLESTFDFSDLNFFGEGVVRVPGTLTAPVSVQWVPAVEGAGAFQLSWGQDSGVSLQADAGFRATDIVVSLADNKVYADIEVYGLGAQVHVFADQLIGELENVQLSVAGSPEAPSLLSFSADVYASPEGNAEIVRELSGDEMLPGDPILVAHLSVRAIPEPATWATMGIGLVGVVGMARQRRARARVS